MSKDQLLASRLSNRITFKKQDSIRQPNGSKELVWTDYKSTWAEVITIGGEEGRLAAANSSTVKYRLVLRYREDLSEDMRISALGREVNILSIRDPEGRKELLEINAEYKQGATNNG